MSRSKPTLCRHCTQAFASNNKLHKHLRVCLATNHRVNKENMAGKATDTPVIESSAKRDKSKGLAFRSWHFATFKAKLAKNRPAKSICRDTGCTMSLIDLDFLQQRMPDVKIKHSNAEVTVRSIRSCTHQCS